MKINNRSCATVMFFVLSLSVLLMSSIPSSASDNARKETEITGIDVLDNAIRITANAPISYKLYRPEDPFRITVDIEGARLGRFIDKMFPDRSGVSEISPVQILKPAATARLNILLQLPASVTPELTDSVLVLNIKSEGRVPDDAAAGSTPDDGITEDDTSAAGEIVGLSFKKTSEGAELVLKADGVVPKPKVVNLDGRVLIDIPDVSTDVPLPSGIALPVKGIQYRTEEDKLRFIIDMEAGAKATVAALDDELIVHISSGGVTGEATEAVPQTSCSGAVKKQPVSFDVQDADLTAVIGILNYDMTGCNIVINPEDVKAKKITMKLSNVPWNQALDIILKTFGLEKIVDGNVIRIVTKRTHEEEEKAAAETAVAERNAKIEMENVVQHVFHVNFADVDKVKDAIEKAKILSSRGSLSTDLRIRSIIVNDVPSCIKQIEDLIVTLDKRTPQVLIEAKIVDVSKNAESDLGIEWGGYWSPTATKSAFNVVGSQGTTVSSGTIGPSSSSSSGPSITSFSPSFPSLVSLPTTLGTNAAVTVGYLNPARTLGLDMRLSALETLQKSKTISAPKIMTIDNEKAVIKSGQKIPYTVSSANTGPNVAFIDAALQLTVTPHVSPDKTIRLDIQATNNTPGSLVQGEPEINEAEIDTHVLLKDGETVVLGGILKSEDLQTENGVPGLSKIPVLGGLLFTEKNTTLTTEELLIFITPRVIEQ